MPGHFLSLFEREIVNKQFTIYGGLTTIFGIVSCLLLKLELPKASSVFSAVTAVLFVFFLSWGVFPNPLKVRKRNAIRLLLFPFFHFIILGIVGMSNSVIAACTLSNATKSIETLTQTYSAFENLKQILISLLKFESINLQGIVWVYVVLLVAFMVPLYKFLRSWGWACIISGGVTLLAGFLSIKFLWGYGIQWKAVCVTVVFFFVFLTGILGKKYWYTPAIA